MTAAPNADDIPDFRPPAEYISEETLDELAYSTGPGPEEMAALVAQWLAGDGIPELDPAVKELLLDLGGFAAGDEDELGVPAAVGVQLCRRAAVIGYFGVRTMLGTIDRPLLWSADVDSGLELLEQTSEIEIADLPLPRTWEGQPSYVLFDQPAVLAADAEGDSDGLFGVLGSVCMAMDSAMTSALLEHDAVLGRGV